MFIPDDVWNYIKTFLFHDIKIHGKHLKNDKYVKKYNKVVKIFPFLIKKYNGPRIIYNSAKKGTRIVKFVYVLRHNRIRKLIIVTGKGLHSKNQKNPYVSKDLGILKYSVPEYIKNNFDLMKKVNSITEAVEKDGGGGAFYIYLKKKL